MVSITQSTRKFKNTFASQCLQKELNVDQIIIGLRFGAIHYDKLPPEVKAAVDPVIEEMGNKPSTYNHPDGTPYTEQEIAEINRAP